MDTSLLEIFSTRLRETRGDMMQATFAQKIGVSRASLSSYENGSRIPDIETLKHIHEETGVSLYYLLGLTDSRDDALATAQKDTGLSEEALRVLSERKSAQYVINRLLISEDLDYFAHAVLRYQLHTVDVITHEFNSWEMINAAREAERDAATVSNAVNEIFSAKGENDSPPGNVLDEIYKRGYVAMIKEAESLLQSMTDEQYQEALEMLREMAKKKEVTDAQETPEQ